jgi:hypothetical protein
LFSFLFQRTHTVSGVFCILHATLFTPKINESKGRGFIQYQNNICQYRRQHLNKYECFTAVSLGVTCYFSLCVARIQHTHR